MNAVGSAGLEPAKSSVACRVSSGGRRPVPKSGIEPEPPAYETGARPSSCMGRPHVLVGRVGRSAVRGWTRRAASEWEGVD